MLWDQEQLKAEIAWHAQHSRLIESKIQTLLLSTLNNKVYSLLLVIKIMEEFYWLWTTVLYVVIVVVEWGFLKL